MQGYKTYLTNYNFSMKIVGKLDIYLSKLISIEFSDRKKIISGFLLDYSEDWILIQNNPVDYMIDGFSVIRNINIKDIYQDEVEEFTEKVIQLKGYVTQYAHEIPLGNIEDMIRYLNAKYGLFLLIKKSGKAVYPGRLISLNEKKINIEWINTRGKWTEERTFKLDKIRIIEFESDYLISLKLASELL